VFLWSLIDTIPIDWHVFCVYGHGTSFFGGAERKPNA
jgi:hypothetical protein